jgi:hypothetical protein
LENTTGSGVNITATSKTCKECLTHIKLNPDRMIAGIYHYNLMKPKKGCCLKALAMVKNDARQFYNRRNTGDSRGGNV